MTKGHAALVLVFVVAFAPLASPAAGAPGRSGLTGIVTRGPTTPVCRVGEPCTAPAAGFVLVFDRGGAAPPVRARTDAEGRYHVALPAGTYTVGGTTWAIGRGVEPVHVHVRAGHVDRIDFSVDTGIR